MVWPDFASSTITSLLLFGLLLFGSLFTALKRLRKGKRLSIFGIMDNGPLTKFLYRDADQTRQRCVRFSGVIHV
jgi:hypothetical protein